MLGQQPRRALPLDERDVRILLGLQRDADERDARGERRLHASLPARDHGEVDTWEDLVAREDPADEDALVLEVTQVVHRPGDEDAGVERARAPRRLRGRALRCWT